MSLADDLAPVDEWQLLRGRVDQLQGELAAARRALGELAAETDRLRRVAEVSREPLRVPRWLTPRKKTGKTGGHQATVCLLVSDLHLDEVVDPAEVGGLNGYSRVVAEQRLERLFANTLKLTEHHLAGLSYDGAVVFLGGDLISGDIHEELRETNEGTTLETVLHWSGRLAAGLGVLADRFGKVHVVSVSGNHGRRTRKPRAKRRTRDNFDWLVGQMLARHFDADSRVTFTIPDSTDAQVTVYETRFLLNHGDETRGGGGIGGIWPPLMRMRAKKLARYQHEPFEWLVLGHWHQYVHSQGLIVNGSLKGYDEWAAVNNYPPERPQQALWIVTPEHGVSFAAPVLVADRKREGW